MKYLKLYEAFESNTMSKVFKYIKNKFKNESGEAALSHDRFKHSLLSIQNEFNIPLDNIKDNDVKYLNKSQALKIKGNEVNNSKSIYCLKFWFSISEGYLGFTGTGNYDYDYDLNNNKSGNVQFNNTEIDYIKNDLGIKTGELKRLKDYNELKHGQLIIGIFGDDSDSENLGLAKIWRQNNVDIYAIQCVNEGSQPYDESWISFGDDPIFNGKNIYSWSMGSVNNPADDHHKIHLYTPSNEPLILVGYDIEEDKSVNPLNYNLPLDSNFRLVNWSRSRWSIGGTEKLEKADFAIVLILDDILKSNLQPVELKRKGRSESREGATKLISNDEIKKMNIDRYFNKIFKNMVNIDTSEIRNLQKIVSYVICGDLSYISIYNDIPSIDYLGNITSTLYNLMRSDNEDDRKNYLKKATNLYKDLSETNRSCMQKYSKSMDVIRKNFDNEQIKEFFTIILRIGKKISEYVNNQNIENIEDLRMFLIKFRSIRAISREPEFQFEYYIRNLISEFPYQGDFNSYIKDIRDINMSDNIKKAKHIERYVDSILG